MTVNAGASEIVMSGSSALCLSIGSISRGVGGTLDFTLSGTQSSGNGVNTLTSTSNGILAGQGAACVTVNGTNWATSTGTTATGYITTLATSTTGDLGSHTGAGFNFEPSARRATVTAAKTFNTLNLTGPWGSR